MKTWSLPFGLCTWVEPKFGLGLSFNFVKPRTGIEPFITAQLLCLMFFVAIKSSETGWLLDPMRDKFIRMTDEHRAAIAEAESRRIAAIEDIKCEHSVF